MQKNILLIVTGGIAAYKVLEVIRLLRKDNVTVRTILTKGGAQFVTPLSISALSEEKVYDDLWSLTDEQEMGHIRLARSADLVVVAPASADFLAKSAHGMANDLASTCILANQAPVMVAPAMNPAMWDNPATQANVDTLRQRGWHFIGPQAGDMACGEQGVGRLSEPTEIYQRITAQLGAQTQVLAGKKAIVTSGPTVEAIDPVRVLANRSSGKQGHAIASALRDAGADVTLISGPVNIAAPEGVHIIAVETAQQMLEATQSALPCDIAICAAAVADWKPDYSPKKHKKTTGTPQLTFTENPDILKTLGHLPKGQRPAYVVGFCAESDDLLLHAQEKLNAKGCDAIIANQASDDDNPFGRDSNHVIWVDQTQQDDWGPLPKSDIGVKLVARIADHFNSKE